MSGCFFILLLYSTGMAQTGFHEGDRVCFVGNSITYNGGYHHNIALYYATRFPADPIRVINCGIGGNVAANVIARMDSDILVNKPTAAAVKLGMNDVKKDLYTKEAAAKPGIQQLRQEALDTYRKNYETVIQLLLKSHCKVILQTPSIYDQTAVLSDKPLTGRNDALEICAGYVKALGEKYQLQVIDYWTLLNDLTKQVQAKEPSATLIGADRVHPGAVGHFIMAYAFLKGTVGGIPVSELVLDVSKKGGEPATKNGQLAAFSNNDQGIGFRWLEKALPFPVANDAVKALGLVPFAAELNRETVVVKGLTPGTYQLRIDGIVAGSYSAGEWSAGIDLSMNNKTPQYQQAQQVLKLFQQYWPVEAAYRNMRGIEFGRLRGKGIITLADAEQYFAQQSRQLTDTATVAYNDLQNYLKTYLPNKRKEREMLDKMDALHTAIYTAAQPVVHQYQITKE